MEEASNQLGLVKPEFQPDVPSFLMEIEGHGTVCVSSESIYELTRTDGTKIHVAGILSPDDGCVSFIALPPELLTKEPDELDETEIGETFFVNSAEEDVVQMLEDDDSKKKQHLNNFQIVDLNQIEDFSVNISGYSLAGLESSPSNIRIVEDPGTDLISSNLSVFDNQTGETLGFDLPEEEVDIKPGIIVTEHESVIAEAEKKLYAQHEEEEEDDENVKCSFVGLSLPLKRGRPRKDKEKEIEPPFRKGSFKCPLCTLSFPSMSSFKTHRKVHVDVKPHVCNICGDSFNVGKNLDLHMLLHNVGNLTCPECNKTFTRYASFKAHLPIHEEEENIFCSECGDEFTKNEQLEQHMETHKKEWENTLYHSAESTKYSCKTCNKMFSNPYSFEAHKKEHQKLRNQLIALAPKRKRKRMRDGSMKNGHECDLCSKSFPKPSQLLRHKRVHTGEKPFRCSICDTSFTQKGSLQIHMSRHNGLKPHRCSLCSLKFSQRGNLIAHINKVHSLPKDGEEVYKCMNCPCVFKKLASLNCHITRFHLNAKRDKDDKPEDDSVDNLISQIAELRSNIPPQSDTDILQQAIKNSGLPVDPKQKKEDDKVFLVTIAERRENGVLKSYRVRQRIEGHVRWHQCSTCVKEFKKPSDLIRHIRIHTREKPFKCDLCFRSFSIKSTLQTHRRTHTNGRLYECSICGKRVSSVGSLKTHYKHHYGVRPFNCEICNKAFTTSGQLKAHCRTLAHKNKGEMKPPNMLSDQELLNDLLFVEPLVLADGGFKQQLSRKEKLMYKSQNASVTERPYECDYCHFKFRKSSHVKQHMLQHTGVKPFACCICQKSFITKGVLKMHLKTHLGEKDFCCDKCPSKFSTKGSLKRHNQTLHTNERPFLCPYCSKRFKTSVTCKKHIRIHRFDVGMSQILGYKVNESEFLDSRNEKTHLLLETPKEKVLVENTFQALDPQTAVILPEALLTDTDKIALPDNLTQENIREIEQTLNQQLFTSTEVVENTLILNDKCTLFSKEQETVDYQSLSIKPLILSEQVPQPCLDQAVFSQGDELQTVSNLSEILPETNQVTKQVATVIETLEEVRQDGIPNIIIQSGIQPLTSKCVLCFNNFFRKEGEDFCEDCRNKSEKIISPPAILKPLNKVQNKREYVCELCDWRTSNKSIFTSHINIHSKDLIFHCSVCPEKFKNESGLKHHMKIHSVKLVQRIEITPRRRSKGPFKEFSEEENALIAFQDVKSGTSVSEKVLIASAAEKLRINEKKKADTKSEDESRLSLGNDCKYCTKSFKKPSDLVRHVRIHTGERPYECQHCNKRFTVKSTLSSHMRTHEGAKHEACHICDALFSSKSSLKVHMRLHTGAKPFECTVCGQKFRTSGHRKNHMLSHNKNKMFTYVGWKKQQLHMLNKLAVALKEDAENSPQTEKNDLYSGQENTLPLLGASMPNISVTEDLLQQLSEQNVVLTTGDLLETDENVLHHVYSEEATTNQAPVRYGIISLENDLNPIHIYVENPLGDKTATITTAPILSSDQVECELSVTVDENSIQLPTSEISTTDKGHVCNYCGSCFVKKSQIQRHVRIHTGERPYSCEICGKRFTQSNALEAHLKAHRGERAFECPHCEFTCVQKGNLRIHINRAHQRPEQTVAAKTFVRRRKASLANNDNVTKRKMNLGTNKEQNTLTKSAPLLGLELNELFY